MLFHTLPWSFQKVYPYYKKFFEESISGKDKVKFQKAVDDAGISYTIIRAYILEAVEESVEKK